MSKIDKMLETRENEIQELTETEEKSSQKEKKYFMQIENYNKKIEGLKKETARLQKSIALLKKDARQVESVRVGVVRMSLRPATIKIRL